MFACIHSNGIAASGIAREFSPQVEVIDPATVVLNIAGMERLFGAPSKIATLLAQRAGPAANVSIAPHRNAAVYAARGYPGIAVIPADEVAARLGGLPVALLDTSPEILATLHQWGIHTFRELADLPVKGLAERFGPEGARLWMLARGEASAPLLPEVEAPAYRASLDLEHPIDLLEPLAFVLSRLLHQVCDQLTERGFQALVIGLQLDLETGGPHRRAIRLPVPMRNPILFLKLLTLDLEAHPPAAPITRVTVEMEQAEPRSVQEGLFLPPSPEPEKLELTLKRIGAIVGENNVGSPRLVDSHRPGAFQLAAALEQADVEVTVTAATLAFRAFRPPVAAKVTPAGGPPEQVWSNKAHGKVVMRAGPWRTSGEWWSQTPWARDDWDLSLSDGALYRVYREYFSGRWYLDGRYD